MEKANISLYNSLCRAQSENYGLKSIVMLLFFAVLVLSILFFSTSYVAAENDDPYISAYPQFFWISGENWPEGVEISLKIYDVNASLR